MAEIKAPWLNSRVKSLELELKILKAKIAQTADGSKSFSSLYGVLKGQSKSTLTDIQKTEYQGLEWIP